MSITRLGTYSQIKGSSYKLPCKVVTSASISLSGGAPLIVDSYTLNINDRVLAVSQSTATQNGIYIVQDTGSGANGTWVRAVDFSLSDDIFQGAQVYISTGSAEKGSSYYLNTSDPITLDSTPLLFLKNANQGMNLIQENLYTITGSYQWTKPANAKIIYVVAVGGGGGGASGGAVTGTGVAGGAGGGGGGAVVMVTLPAIAFAATESVVVGAGGAGGIGSTRIGAGTNIATNGSTGSNGETSIFGEIVAPGGASGSYTVANNALGLGGAPPPVALPSITVSTTTGYTISSNQIVPIALSGPGGSGAATDKSPAAVPALTMSFFVPTGGGFGGNPGSTTVPENGGAGGFSSTSFGNIDGGSSGFDGVFTVVDGGSGNLVAPFFGTGGGGGFGSYRATGDANSSNGGDGSVGAGGGGGGTGRVGTNTSPNSAKGGNGGKGGDGVVFVYVYG